LIPANAEEEALMRAANEAEKEAQKEAEARAKQAEQDQKDKASGKDEVVLESIPTLGPISPPGVNFISFAQMALMVRRMEVENESIMAEKLE